ncbi:MAG TPA: hypothetical protein VFA79_03895 [Myxococcales bacterium]|nr:hypothetical protein [Myxococcales bacterium]
MITPGLYRRCLRRSLRFRVLLLWWAALLVPAAIAAAPAFAFLRAHLDHSPRAPDVVAWMDGFTSIELLRQVHAQGAWRTLAGGLGAGALAMLVVSPFVAGAMVASAGADEPLQFRPLLAAAGAHYGRMLRVALAALIPLGLAAAATAGIVKLALDADSRALTETGADRIRLLAAAAAGFALFVAHLLVDAARAQFAADPGRRSAIRSLWNAAEVLIRRPLRVLAIGALGTLAGAGFAAVLMAVRLQIPQRAPATLLLAWLLAQAAQVAIGWGRAARIEGFAELCRIDAEDRARRPGSPAAASGDLQVVHSATLSALEPPGSGAAR